jgi:hypothetical protein
MTIDTEANAMRIFSCGASVQPVAQASSASPRNRDPSVRGPGRLGPRNRGTALSVEDAMTTYVQAEDGGIWHWCNNCSHYPQTVAKQVEYRPSWNLCPECEAKELDGTCRS